jgi:SNF2 family DNA or RNA helicase
MRVCYGKRIQRRHDMRCEKVVSAAVLSKRNTCRQIVDVVAEVCLNTITILQNCDGQLRALQSCAAVSVTAARDEGESPPVADASRETQANAVTTGANDADIDESFLLTEADAAVAEAFAVLDAAAAALWSLLTLPDGAATDGDDSSASATSGTGRRPRGSSAPAAASRSNWPVRIAAADALALLFTLLARHYQSLCSPGSAVTTAGAAQPSSANQTVQLWSILELHMPHRAAWFSLQRFSLARTLRDGEELLAFGRRRTGALRQGEAEQRALARVSAARKRAVGGGGAAGDAGVGGGSDPQDRRIDAALLPTGGDSDLGSLMLLRRAEILRVIGHEAAASASGASSAGGGMRRGRGLGVQSGAESEVVQTATALTDLGGMLNEDDLLFAPSDSVPALASMRQDDQVVDAFLVSAPATENISDAGASSSAIAPIPAAHRIVSLLDRLRGPLGDRVAALYHRIVHGAFGAAWETRHGCWSAIRALLAHTPLPPGSASAGTTDASPGVFCMYDSYGGVIAQDLCLRVVAVLALERFADYARDVLLAPVREVAVCALGQAAGCLSRTGRTRLIETLLELCGNTEWHVRHGCFQGLRAVSAASAGSDLPSPPTSSSASDGILQRAFSEAIRAMDDPSEDVAGQACATVVALLPVAPLVNPNDPRKASGSRNPTANTLFSRIHIAISAARLAAASHDPNSLVAAGAIDLLWTLLRQPETEADFSAHAVPRKDIATICSACFVHSRHAQYRTRTGAVSCLCALLRLVTPESTCAGKPPQPSPGRELRLWIAESVLPRIVWALFRCLLLEEPPHKSDLHLHSEDYFAELESTRLASAKLSELSDITQVENRSGAIPNTQTLKQQAQGGSASTHSTGTPPESFLRLVSMCDNPYVQWAAKIAEVGSITQTDRFRDSSGSALSHCLEDCIWQCLNQCIVLLRRHTVEPLMVSGWIEAAIASISLSDGEVINGRAMLMPTFLEFPLAALPKTGEQRINVTEFQKRKNKKASTLLDEDDELFEEYSGAGVLPGEITTVSPSAVFSSCSVGPMSFRTRMDGCAFLAAVLAATNTAPTLQWFLSSADVSSSFIRTQTYALLVLQYARANAPSMNAVPQNSNPISDSIREDLHACMSAWAKDISEIRGDQLLPTELQAQALLVWLSLADAVIALQRSLDKRLIAQGTVEEDAKRNGIDSDWLVTVQSAVLAWSAESCTLLNGLQIASDSPPTQLSWGIVASSKRFLDNIWQGIFNSANADTRAIKTSTSASLIEDLRWHCEKVKQSLHAMLMKWNDGRQSVLFAVCSATLATNLAHCDKNPPFLQSLNQIAPCLVVMREKKDAWVRALAGHFIASVLDKREFRTEVVANQIVTAALSCFHRGALDASSPCSPSSMDDSWACGSGFAVIASAVCGMTGTAALYFNGLRPLLDALNRAGQSQTRSDEKNTVIACRFLAAYISARSHHDVLASSLEGCSFPSMETLCIVYFSAISNSARSAVFSLMVALSVNSVRQLMQAANDIVLTIENRDTGKQGLFLDLIIGIIGVLQDRPVQSETGLWADDTVVSAHRVSFRRVMGNFASLILRWSLRFNSSRDASVRRKAGRLLRACIPLLPSLGQIEHIQNSVEHAIESSKSAISSTSKFWQAMREASATVQGLLQGASSSAQRLPPSIASDLNRDESGETITPSSVNNAGGSVHDYLLAQPSVSLRDYQVEGVNWLEFMARNGLAGVLADDMGLGKTLQTLSCIARRVHVSLLTPNSALCPTVSIVVCPSTLVLHWISEVDKYFSQVMVDGKRVLTAVEYDPKSMLAPDSSYLRRSGSAHQIIVVSYSGMRAHIADIVKSDFLFCVLDEGHIIQNPASKVAEAACTLGTIASHRLVLTGTPIQNNILDIWALFDFLIPGYLGDYSSFKSTRDAVVRRAVTATASEEEMLRANAVLGLLHRQVLPFILRRTKGEVLKELPPKIVQDIVCKMPERQAGLYQGIAKLLGPLSAAVKYGELFQDDSQQMDVVDVSCNKKMIVDSKVGASSSSVFRGLHCLRLAASHPALVPVPMLQALGASTKLCSLVEGLRRTSIEDSGKLLALHSLLMTYGIHAGSNATHSSDSSSTPSVDEVSLSTPAKAVIFAQSNGILDCVADGMFARAPFKGMSFLRLTADKSAMDRGRIAAKFNEDASVRVLLSTTATGGLGLNLSAVNIVLFLEHSWNPMVDLQAMDRAHRIGQTRTVNVYRLISENTIEERIMSLQEMKRKIAATVVTQDNASVRKMIGEVPLLDLLASTGSHHAPDAEQDGDTMDESIANDGVGSNDMN